MEADLTREARPMEGGRIGVRGTSGGGGRLSARGRGRQWRRQPRCEEELPVDVALSSALEGWPAGDTSAGVPHVGRACVVVEHQCVSRGFAAGERQVKTQSGLGRTDNDPPEGVVVLSHPSRVIAG
uniref:Uncharacterized protein n=1 Tax=Oryza meridionalis TaxID=40149 RepID=A0A0E0END7_9ORYZ